MDLTLVPFGQDDVVALQRLLESDGGYTERVTGYPPGPSDALSLLIGRPDDVEDEDKVVLGGWQHGVLVSVVDVLRHWPTADTAHIGLLLVDGRRQGEGLGRQTLAALDAAAQSWTWLRQWRIAVVRTNSRAFGFWERMGYTPTGEVKPYRYDHLESESVILTRPARTGSSVDSA